MDKNQILVHILKSAKLYKQELLGKDILVIAKRENKLESYTIQFKDYHYKHFTGVDSKLTASTFFSKALTNRLHVDEFIAKDSFLIEKKMKVLENAMKFPYSAKMIGDFNYSGIKIEADMGAGNLQYVMAFRNNKDSSFYPVSLLEEDIRKSAQPSSPIVAILRKKKEDVLYDEITYISKKISVSKLHFPKEIKEKLSEEVYNTLKPQQMEQLSAQKEVHQKKESYDQTHSNRPSSIAERIAQKQKIIQQRAPVKHTHPHRNTDQEL